MRSAQLRLSTLTALALVLGFSSTFGPAAYAENDSSLPAGDEIALLTQLETLEGALRRKRRNFRGHFEPRRR